MSYTKALKLFTAYSATSDVGAYLKKAKGLFADDDPVTLRLMWYAFEVASEHAPAPQEPVTKTNGTHPVAKVAQRAPPIKRERVFVSPKPQTRKVAKRVRKQ